MNMTNHLTRPHSFSFLAGLAKNYVLKFSPPSRCNNLQPSNCVSHLCTRSVASTTCGVPSIKNIPLIAEGNNDCTFKNHQRLSCHLISRRLLADRSKSKMTPTEINEAEYEAIADETMDSLCEFFEDLAETAACPDDYDCAYASGVLTIHVGASAGTYVVNKQTPNKQIWLSSPISGPKRYDYYDGQWLYSRDMSGLHALLSTELSHLMNIKVDLSDCKLYSK